MIHKNCGNAIDINIKFKLIWCYCGLQYIINYLINIINIQVSVIDCIIRLPLYCKKVLESDESISKDLPICHESSFRVILTIILKRGIILSS